MSVLTLCVKVALNFCYFFFFIFIFLLQFYHSTDKLEFILLIAPVFLSFGLFEKANSSGGNVLCLHVRGDIGHTIRLANQRSVS